MANLVELFDNVVEFQNYNGVPLAAGKLYVYALGRTRLMDTWSDVDGESLNPNPIILDDLGQCHCYCSDDFDYTLVICDQYDNEIFSIDKYLYSQGSHSHADVAVAPSETIAVSSYHVGETTVYVPYLTGQLGKVYQGIEPIVVNNTEDKISANHVPLGVQDPLYFVQDDEEGCIIGCSAQTEIPSAISGKWDAASDAVITNSAQWAENTEYEEGNYISIDNNVINVTGLSPVPTDTASTGLVAEVSADIVSQIPSTAGLATESWVEGKNYATVSQLDNKLDKADSAKFYPMTGNPSGFLTAHQSLNGYATEQWVEDKGYLTGIDIPESANWNSTYNTVHDNSASWTGGSTPNPQIPVTGINGIKISESGDQVVFEVSGDYYTNDNPSGFITGVDLSDYATTAQLAEKQDITGMTAYQPVGNYQTAGDYLTTADSANFYTTANESGFITGVDLTPYQTTAGMTAYQPVGDYLTTGDSANFYTTANESGFITGVDLTPYQTVEGMTAYQPAGDYLTTGDSANFYTTANESGFISEVPAGTMNESAFEYNGSNKISAYNGSAFAGGGGADLDFGYDESGAISSINTSALSDSRAGTPLYVEAPLFTGQSGDSAYIGSDINETVLWTGDREETGGSNKNHWNVPLSEQISSFERLRFHYMQILGDMKNYATVEVEVNDNSAGYKVPAWPEGTVNGNWMCMYIRLSGNNGYYEGAYNPANSNVNNPTLSNYWLAGNFNKVVGINRKRA